MAEAWQLLLVEFQPIMEALKEKPIIDIEYGPAQPSLFYKIKIFKIFKTRSNHDKFTLCLISLDLMNAS